MVDQKKEHFVKIWVVGENGVGKTSLINRESKQSVQAWGDFIECVRVGVKRQIWELNYKPGECARGDEAAGMVACLVYDVTNEESFNVAREHLRQRKENQGLVANVPIVLIGNKCDDKSHRWISTSRGEALAKEHEISFVETSATNGENVNQAFDEAVRLALEVMKIDWKPLAARQRGGSYGSAVLKPPEEKREVKETKSQAQLLAANSVLTEIAQLRAELGALKSEMERLGVRTEKSLSETNTKMMLSTEDSNSSEKELREELAQLKALVKASKKSECVIL